MLEPGSPCSGGLKLVLHLGGGRETHGEDGDHPSWGRRTGFLHVTVELEHQELTQHHLALQGKHLCSSGGRERFPIAPNGGGLRLGGLGEVDLLFPFSFYG